MNDVQRMGGVAGLLMAAAFVVGFALFLGLLANSGFDSGDPVEAVAFLADYQTLLSIWYLIIYVLFGILLVVLALALYERLKTGAPVMARTATAFGLIWAGLVLASGMIANIGIATVVDLYANDPVQAGSVWVAIESVQVGLGGGIELVGGLWALLIGWAALRTGALPRTLNYLGVVIGVSGILTVVPVLEVLGAVFGLGLIVWFAWLGIVMVRKRPSGSVTTERVRVDPRFV